MNQLKVLKHEKGHVYLLATKRNARQSIAAIKEALSSLKPHVVAIEMCLSKLKRFASMQKRPPAEAHALDLIPQRLKQKAVGERIMLDMLREALTYGCRVKSRRVQPPQQQYQPNQQNHSHNQPQQQQPPQHILQELQYRYPALNVFQLQPRVFRFDEVGREVSVIFGQDVWQLDYHNPRFLVNANVDYRVMLAGRPIEDTLRGIAEALTHDEANMIRVYAKNFTKLFVENSTDLSIISHILRRNCRLRNVLVEERNEHMAGSLVEAINATHRRLKQPPKQPFDRQPIVKVLAVVKSSRLNGIRKCWRNIIEESATKKQT